MDNATCAIEEDGKICGRPNYGHGLCGMHYQRWKKHGDPLYRRPTFEERIWAGLDRRSPDECWPWRGYINRYGYGSLKRQTDGRTTVHVTHRLVYERLVGPIPAGLTLDHLCHDPDMCTLGDECPHRRCCNPAHLKPATNAENTLRGGGPGAINAVKTHCPQGHEYSPENTYLDKAGGRYCIACRRVWNRDYMRRKAKERREAA